MKTLKVAGGRGSLLGDIVMTLPIIPTLKEQYSDHKIEFKWVISKKCRQIAPLLIDQPGINSIYITKEEEFLTSKERAELEKECDIFLDPSPTHEMATWYNTRDCVDESIKMHSTGLYDTYRYLIPRAAQKPRLKAWWVDKSDNVTYNNQVSIWPFAGYGKGLQRSPSIEWWKEMIVKLIDAGYYVNHFGHYLEPTIFESKNYEDDVYHRHTGRSLFEQVRICYLFDKVIGTDSGSMWLMGALGMRWHVNLLTSWENGHNSNPLALAPQNWRNNEVNLWNQDINQIRHEDVLNALK